MSKKNKTFPKDVTFEIHVEEDDIAVRGNALASGNDAEDRMCEDEIIRRLETGDVWAWASVRVVARYGDFTGEDCLGACSYDNEADFKSNGYYQDMCGRAFDDLRDTMRASVELGAEALQTLAKWGREERKEG